MPKFTAQCPDCGREIDWRPTDEPHLYKTHVVDFRTACCEAITVARKPQQEAEVGEV
jgi:endogenous inhibitor of DNA gyrase (YacG/DUF329 family)